MIFPFLSDPERPPARRTFGEGAFSADGRDLWLILQPRCLASQIGSFASLRHRRFAIDHGFNTNLINSNSQRILFEFIK